MTAYERFIDALRDHGNDVKNGRTKCPAHNGNSNNSLSVKPMDGSMLVHCHGGCETADVLAALNMTMQDMYDDRKGMIHDYGDRKVHRCWDKKFRQSGNTKSKTLFHASHLLWMEDEDTPVFVVEGEKDVLAIESVGGRAVCNAGGAGKAHLFDWSPLKGRHVVIVRDKDDAGHKHAEQVSNLLDDIAASVKVVEAATGKDAADHIAADRTLDDFVEVESELLVNLKSAALLDDLTFKELAEHVPNLVVEGFGVLAGSPKVGKSWLATGLALACAQGGMVFGSIKVTPRAVLLLALEDGERRLQNRMWKLNGDDPLPVNLDYITVVQPGAVMPTIKEWLKSHRRDENPPLVILDTLGKVRPQRKAGEDAYISDYEMGSYIKRIADSIPGAAILVIHHTRKMGAADWLDTVAGTNGITGSADYVLVLTRQRKSTEGLLAVTGRDIQENEYAVNCVEGVWKLAGGSFGTAADAAEDRREKGKLGDRALEVLAFVNGRKETRAADLKVLGIDKDQAYVYLSRLADKDRIRKIGRGVYGPVDSDWSVRNDADDDAEITQLTQTTHSLDQENDEQPRCKHCDEPLWHPGSIERGYCAKRECFAGEENNE